MQKLIVNTVLNSIADYFAPRVVYYTGANKKEVIKLVKLCAGGVLTKELKDILDARVASFKSGKINAEWIKQYEAII